MLSADRVRLSLELVRPNRSATLFRAIVVGWCLTQSIAPSRAYADVPRAIASPSAVPVRTCTEPETIAPDAAYAHEIVDARTLAFIAYVKDMNYRERSAARKRAAKPVLNSDELDRALTADCSFDEVEYRTARFTYAAARYWTAHEALDVEGAARLAIASLLLKDRISAATRDATLAVFATGIDDLDARIAKTALPPAQDACLGSIDARAASVNQPFYPAIARIFKVSGRVSILVSLDEHGYVKSATLYGKDLEPPKAAGDDLVDQSVLSAGTTDYTPAFVRCKPQPGSYLFRAVYDRQ